MFPALTFGAEKTLRVGLFADAVATDRRSREGVERVVKTAKDMKIERVTSQTITSKELNDFDVLIFPGGSGNGEASALGAEGGAAVEEFVARGKGYIGICAGSYLMNEGWNEKTKCVELINAYCFDLDNWARGEGWIKVKFAEPFGDLLTSETIWYENGPIFAPAALDLPAYTSLAKFATDYTAKGAPTGMMIDHDAIVAAPYRKGRVVGFSPHPELSPAFNSMLLSAIRWAAAGDDGTTPTVRSVLLNDDKNAGSDMKAQSKNLTVKQGKFYLGDEPFNIHSGAIHYFRTMPQDWRDRLTKLKACGLNTVETYVPLHVLKAGKNELVVFEQQHAIPTAAAEFVKEQVWGSAKQ